MLVLLRHISELERDSLSPDEMSSSKRETINGVLATEENHVCYKTARPRRAYKSDGRVVPLGLLSVMIVFVVLSVSLAVTSGAVSTYRRPFLTCTSHPLHRMVGRLVNNELRKRSSRNLVLAWAD